MFDGITALPLATSSRTNSAVIFEGIIATENIIQGHKMMTQRFSAPSYHSSNLLLQWQPVKII